MTTTRRPVTTAAVVVVAGLVLLGVAAAVALSWRDVLPDPVAVHWGRDGRPNGFSSLTDAVRLMVVSGAVLVLVFGALILVLGQSAGTRRIGAAATIWSALFISGLTVGSLYGQRGLADARSAGGIGGALLVAILASVVVAIGVGALVPGDPRRPTSQPVAPDAPRVPLVGGDGWEGRAHSGPVVGVGLVVVAVVVAAAVLTRVWSLLAVVAVIAVVVGALFSFRVRVDSEGLTVRSVLGWPRLRVPLDEVVRADVGSVRPLAEFGGWGWRVGRGGRVGIVLRRGEALVVERTGGRSVVVTVDDATTAAGNLNALADRGRAVGPLG